MLARRATAGRPAAEAFSTVRGVAVAAPQTPAQCAACRPARPPPGIGRLRPHMLARPPAQDSFCEQPGSCAVCMIG